MELPHLMFAGPILYGVALRIFLGIKTPVMKKISDYGPKFEIWTRHKMLERALVQFTKHKKE